MSEQIEPAQIAGRLNMIRVHADVLVKHRSDPMDLAIDYVSHITAIAREVLLSEAAIRAVTGSDDEALNRKAREDMDTALTAAGLRQEHPAMLRPYNDAPPQ